MNETELWPVSQGLTRAWHRGCLHRGHCIATAHYLQAYGLQAPISCQWQRWLCCSPKPEVQPEVKTQLLQLVRKGVLEMSVSHCPAQTALSVNHHRALAAAFCHSLWGNSPAGCQGSNVDLGNNGKCTCEGTKRCEWKNKSSSLCVLTEIWEEIGESECILSPECVSA